MKVSSEIKEKNLESVIIEFSKEDYAERVEKELKKIRRTAQIHGFRVGMAPMGMIQKMYGDNVLQEQVLDMANSEFSHYIEENKKNMILQPMIDEENSSINFENPENFKFVFEYAIYPDFDIDYNVLQSLTYHKIDVSDEEVDKYIENIRYQHGKYSSPETIEEQDDFISVQYGEDTKGSFYLRNLVEEVSKQFIGKKNGDVVNVDFNKSFINSEELMHFLNIDEKTLEEKKEQDMVYDLTIENIGRMQMAEINEELFKLACPTQTIESAEQFREISKAEIAKEYLSVSDNLFYKQAIELLLEKNPVELPVDFTKKYILNNDERVTAETIDAEFPKYLNSFKMELLQNVIAKEAGFNISQEDVKEAIRRKFFDSYFKNFDYESVKSYLDSMVEKSMQNREQVMKVYSELEEKEIVKFLHTKVQLEEKFATVDEIVKLFQGANAVEEKTEPAKAKAKKTAKAKTEEKAEDKDSAKVEIPKKASKKTSKKSTDE